MAATSYIFTVLLLTILQAYGALAGECCLAYTGIMGTSEEKWCDNYCCSLATIHDCCDTLALRVPEDERSPICGAWFSTHTWAPILISVGLLLSIIGCITCCCCCCCGCCRRNNPGTVLVQGQTTPTVVMSQQTTNMQHVQQMPNDPYRAGYDQ